MYSNVITCNSHVLYIAWKIGNWISQSSALVITTKVYFWALNSLRCLSISSSPKPESCLQFLELIKNGWSCQEAGDPGSDYLLGILEWRWRKSEVRKGRLAVEEEEEASLVWRLRCPSVPLPLLSEYKFHLQASVIQGQCGHETVFWPEEGKQVRAMYIASRPIPNIFMHISPPLPLHPDELYCWVMTLEYQVEGKRAPIGLDPSVTVDYRTSSSNLGFL